MRWICCLVISITAGSANAQFFVNGIVADSATLQPMANVNVTVKHQSYGAITDSGGRFSVLVKSSDTLIISSVGYHSRIFPAEAFQTTMVVYLNQEQRFLKSILIVPGVEIFGIPKLKPENPFINPTYTKAYTETPGVPNMQTFGPSYIFKGVISRFSKYEKERKKLPKIQRENERAKRYLEVISDPSVKEEIKTLHSLSEEEFLTILTLFNEAYRDSIYDFGRTELIALLNMFFAEKSKSNRSVLQK